MRYIRIDQDGTLVECDTANYRMALDQVGPEGWNGIHLMANMFAFVNDCGLLLPEKYNRNPIGGLVLIALGAPYIPYAGPIVITGWDQSATARDESEVIGLAPLQVATISTVHATLSGIATDTGCTPWISDGDRESIATMAQRIADGPVPPVTFGAVR